MLADCFNKLAIPKVRLSLLFTNTNNLDKTYVLLQTTGGKDEPKSR